MKNVLKNSENLHLWNNTSTHHLLTHTSGLGSYFNKKYAESSRDLFRKLDDYKSLIKNDRPAFKPGKRFSYSNTGMFMLGVIIESGAGRTISTNTLSKEDLLAAEASLVLMQIYRDATIFI